MVSTSNEKKGGNTCLYVIPEMTRLCPALNNADKRLSG